MSLDRSKIRLTDSGDQVNWLIGVLVKFSECCWHLMLKVWTGKQALGLELVLVASLP